MDRLIDLVKAGVITTRVITLIVVAAAVYMWISGAEMTQTQQTITMMVIGFYFGGESFADFSKKLLERYAKHMEDWHR